MTDLTPSNRKAAYDKLTELDAKYAADAKSRNELGAKVHDKNLAMVAPFLLKKGLYVITLNGIGEFTGVTPSRARKLGPDELSVIVPGDGEQPKFGSIEKFASHIQEYLKCMIVDIGKISRANELAYTCEGKGDGGEVDAAIADHINGMTSRFGKLPPSKTQIKETKKKELEQAELDKLAMWIDGAGDDPKEEIDFSTMLEKEAKKKAKRQRQKQRKQAERAKAAAAAAEDEKPTAIADNGTGEAV